MKNSKKVALMLFLTISSLNVNGQEIVSTQGNSYSSSVASIAYTIGEVVTNTGTNAINDITQGFHQSNWSFLGVIQHTPNYEATMFPNPTSEILYVQTNNFTGVTYTLIDGNGKIVFEDNLLSEITSIQVNFLAPGSYSVILNNEAQILKTFKLIKTL